MNVTPAVLALIASASVQDQHEQREAVVASLIEAAQRKDEVAFGRIAPDASFVVGDVGHQLSIRDVPSCKNYKVSADQSKQKYSYSEFLTGELRPLPAVKVRFDCSSPYELTFGVEGPRVVGGYVSVFGRAPG